MAAILVRKCVNVYARAILVLLPLICLRCIKCEPRIIGISPSDTQGKIEDGILRIAANKAVLLRLYGFDLASNTRISFTRSSSKAGANCDDLRETKLVYLKVNGSLGNVGQVEVVLPNLPGKIFYYVCLKDGTGNTTRWLHQGSDSDMTKLGTYVQTVKKRLLPLWLEIVFIIFLITLSGLFSGLNLGLMALDPTELKIVMNSGTKSEQKYARKIGPIRKHGNYLLCTLLLGNVLVNSSFTILLDGLIGSGIWAVIGSTAGIVIFGEILPQSVCSRHGLAVGARTLWITKFFMILTFPLSFPISRILDLVLGKEMGTVYNRQQLLEMLRVTAEFNDLEGDEVEIITGVLNYKSKTAEDVMTKLDDCFLLDELSILDFRTMSLIMQSGHSRIPVYENERHNVVGILFVKDLAFVDPDDCTPLKTVMKFYNHPVNFVFHDTHLDKMLEEFKKGQSHLAIVIKVNSEGEGDPFYEAIGVLTLEDVIEEIIQSEIVDETDVYLDNKSGKEIPGRRALKDFSEFASDDVKPKVSSQHALAVYQFLSTAVDAFSNEIISKNVLKRLLQQDVIHTLEIDSDKDDQSTKTYIFRRGHPADYFVLILQGRVEVQVGVEDFTFEEGPFSSFGAKSLTMPSSSSGAGRAATQYIPDFSVKAISTVLYLKISRAVYRAAVRATQMESLGKHQGSDLFTKEFTDIELHESSPLLADGLVPSFSKKSFTSLHEVSKSPTSLSFETSC